MLGWQPHGRGSCARTRRWRARLSLSIFLATVSAAALAPALASAGARTDLVAVGKAPLLPAGTQPLATVAGSRNLHLTVTLAPRDPLALENYAEAVANPASPIYRQFLTPRQFAQRFAPSPASAAAVRAALRSRGLHPGAISANGLSFPVRATVAQIEHAFSLTMAAVELQGGRRGVVNLTAPRISSVVAATVQAVLGLSSFDRPEPTLIRARSTSRATRLAPHVVTGGPQPCSAARSAAPDQSAYTADQIASAYDFTGLYRAGDEGQGVTVALYELEPDDPSDIAAYQSCYGTHTAVSYIPVDGGAGTGAGSGEAALDIEQLIGLAPKVQILVYQGPNANSDSPGSGPYDTYSAIINQDRASVISTSWGECEPLEGQPDALAEETLFEEAAVQGQTILSASGDSGSEDCDQPPPSLPDTQLAVDDPASDPFVTGAGGTSLTAVGPPPTETAWNNGGNVSSLLPFQGGAGGGGISALWPMPAYQTSAPAALNVVNTYTSGTPCSAKSGYCREVPDVSADADPDYGYLIYYNGSGSNPTAPSGWQGTGGTSGAAPLWAAVVALTDAQSACAGAPIGFANPALYRLAAQGENTYFHDVTTGNNDYTGTQDGKYPAGPGYSMATGLGSPDAAKLAPALCADSLRLADPGTQETFDGRRVSLRLKGADAAGAGLRFLVHGLPSGLTMSSSTGQITGKVHKTGSSAVTVEAVDTTGGVRIVHFNWIVDKEPRLSGARLTGVRAAAPRFVITVSTGADEPALQSLTLDLPAGLRLAALHAVKVTARGGGSLAHSAKDVDGHLVVRLGTPATSVRLSLGHGALVASSSLIAAERARRTGLLGFAVTAVDAGGQNATVKTSLRPVS